MTRKVNPKTAATLARLSELLAPNTRWQRSLWSVSSTFLIAELLDACSPPQSQTLSDASQRVILDACKKEIGKDPAIPALEKGALNQHMNKPPNPSGSAFHALAQLRRRIDDDYLMRWAQLFQAGNGGSAERAARSIAMHLLDRGFSETYLSTWLSGKSGTIVDDAGLAQLCVDAHDELASTKPKSFTLLFLFRTPMPTQVGLPENWLESSHAIAEWLKANAFSTEGVRAPAGITLKVDARDKFSALELGSALIDSYVARASMATGKLLEPLPTVWIEGDTSSPFIYARRSRGVKVAALHRQDQIFAQRANSNVDAAIELLSHLQHSSPSAAIAGGWAAVESLLGEPGDRAAAADNLASLVACSIPRAELTSLSYAVAKADGAMAMAMNGMLNRERAAFIADLIKANTPLPLIRPSDLAAIQRLQNFFQDPSGCLLGLQRSIAQAFHRLYRQRNHILHGGITSSIALAPTLRTSARLAGAGIDRVAHGLYADGMTPLELAARARLAIALAQPTMDTASLVSLLGT